MSFVDTLTKLRDAEDFFKALDMAYDEQVVNVNRLHILKAFGQNLDLKAVRAMDEDAAKAACREALAKAYDQFAEGMGAKTFKVFQDAKPGFVPLTSIRRG